MNQRERLETTLRQTDGVRVVKGHRLSGPHSAAWEEGNMIWQSVQEVCALLQER
jgi:hypothetical protein